MNFDLLMVIMAFVLAAYMTCLVTRAFRTGRWGRGNHAVARVDEPVEFWGNICLFSTLTAIVLFDSLRVWRVEDADHVSYAAFVGAGLASLALVKALRTGQALDPHFSRRHEPIQYWLVVGVLIVVIAMTAWVVAN